jgi:predicted acyl esterase
MVGSMNDRELTLPPSAMLRVGNDPTSGARMQRTLIGADVIFDRDLAVTMCDGVVLSANLFRPVDGKPVPVIMSVTPYGKDTGRNPLVTLLMRLSGIRFGKIIHCGGRFD